MYRKLSKFILCVFALALSVPNANAQTKLFTNTPGSNPAVYWRIPSIVRLNNGSLWAFTDKRYYAATDLGNGADNPHKIDIYGCKSSNNGASWYNSAVVLESNTNVSDDKEYLYAFGDAATVVDRESGNVLMMTASGKRGVGSSVAGRPYVVRSIFDGSAWATPTNVSDQFYGPNNAYGTHLFVTSGRIIQSTIYKKDKYYRLYAGVCLYSKNASYVVYSDDFGVTWHYLGGDQKIPVPDGDECKVEELPNGDILLQTRRRAGGTGRYFNVFSFSDLAKGEGSWQASAVTSGASDVFGQTYASACNAEMMLVPAKRASDKKQTYVLLLSAPASSDRSKICIYWKELPSLYSNPSSYKDGWSKYACNNSFSAYTTMILDQTGNIALLAEGSGIWFQSLSLATITSNKFSYCPSASGTYHTTSEPNFEHSVWGLVKPSLSVYGGVFTENQTVTLTAPEGTKIYYTLDGSEPKVPANANTGSQTVAPLRAETTTGTQLYTAPITVSEGVTTLKALAVDNNGNISQTLTTTYRVATKTDDNTVDNTDKSKAGTTISLDHGSSTALYTHNGRNYTYFAFLRHNSTHIQLMASTDALLKPDQQLFKNFQNNLQWTGDDKNGYKLQLYNGRDDNYKITRYGHYAILAPKGYRFLRYEIVMSSTSENNAKLEEYTYQSGSNSEIVVVNSETASSSNDVTLERTLTQPTNVLYFRQDGINANDQKPIEVKSIKLTYVVDDAIDAQLPNENGTQVHSGFVDFGPASSIGSNNNYGFDNEAPSDLETVNVKMTDGTSPQTTTVDGTNYFMATANGDYYLEAPTKFRIVGATANFKRAAAISAEKYAPSTSSNNVKIIFQANDKTQNYLKIDESGSAVNTTSKDEATIFTLAYNTGSGENHYSLQMNDGKYLTIKDNNSKIGTTTDQALWAWDGKGLKSNASGNYIYLGNNQDGKYTWDPRYKQDFIPHIHEILPASNFTATVYNPENTGVANDGVKSLDESKASSSVEVSNLNNDAVHINLSDITSGSVALFNVTLKMIALNPEVATIEAAAIVDGKDDAIGNSPVTSYNYVFNNGNTINVPVVSGTTSATMVFRNAKNDELTNWYTTGYNENNLSVKGGYSNVYLIGSAADDTRGLALSSPCPKARTAVDKAATTQILATNIKDVADPNNTDVTILQDNSVSASEAGYNTVTMNVGDTDDPVTYYLYSADKPTNEIMPASIAQGKHIDFRFYSIKVKPVVAETPKIDIVPIYTSTMKGQQHKNTAIGIDANGLDTDHTYVGVKVTAQKDASATIAYNALTAEAIYTELIKEMKKRTDLYSTEDPLRTVLYVDMSDLATVTTGSAATMQNYASETADNCLFFMPKGFAATNLTNVIAKQDDGTSYRAIGDVRVYDQQPFFSPYSFNTGTFKAIYEREGTANGANTKALVRNMAAVLPFSIKLDASGHPYLNGSVEASDYITFRNITGSGELTGVKKDSNGQPLTYAVVATPVSSLIASANNPYYVTVAEDHDAGFTFNIPGADFASSGTVTSTDDVTTVSADDLQIVNGSWTGHGTYSGVAPTKADGLWYFSKDLFWNSGLLSSAYTNVNVRPFRAYYNGPTSNASKAAVVYDDSEVVSTGINDINMAASNTGKVYSLDGRYVGNSLENLAPGIYIQNGRKVVRK